MGLDVDVPEPPSLRGPQPRAEYEGTDAPDEDEATDDHRRAALAEFLREGAWRDAFEEWAAHTDLTAAEFQSVRRHALTDGFDFYWDPTTDEVGYRVPTLPDAVRAEVAVDDPDLVEEELDSLGRVVAETLKADYLVRDEEAFGFFADEGDDEHRGK